jgi:two-component system LytT family response regulator
MVDLIRAVIVDDEPNNVANLVQLLSKHCPQVVVAGSTYDVSSARELILSEKPDLVFLDISMPGQTGFDLLRSIPAPDFDVIFVTAFNQYGIQAVKFSALDYILKPIDIRELREAVAKALERQNLRQKNGQLENLLSLLKHRQEKEEHRIALPGSRETRFVHPAQIVRCEASNNYTHFFLSGNEKWVVSRPIFEYEELLGEYGFLRCHQSHLVNRKFIRSWVKEDGGCLLMEDGALIPISRQKRELVRQALRH